MHLQAKDKVTQSLKRFLAVPQGSRGIFEQA